MTERDADRRSPRSRAAEFARGVALSWRIFQRTIGAKYRKSFLGYFWMIAPAMLITGAAMLANEAGVTNPGSTTLPYGLFVCIGTLLWQVFAEALDVPHQAFESARSYLTRVHFPREAIVLAQLYESLLTTAVRLATILLWLVLASHFTIGGALGVIVCFYGAVLLGLGIGALLMPFTQLFADLHQTLKLLVTYGLFLTPAFYQPQGDGLFARIVAANPVSPLMTAARDLAADLPLSTPIGFAVALGGGAAAAIAGLLLLRAVAPIVIERMLLGGR
ncbi:MAG: ABC transporter permease [Planctomycetes bacterium]|nr:ABC transporter permease [Planctomycetota bacterium]